MALKATIFKAEVQISDIDRHHYQTYNLTVAQHPSETDERMMVRLIAFALYAGEDLAFTRGLSSDSEPELWKVGPTGAIDLWIELGQPDEKRIRKACGKAERVVVVSYDDRKAEIWWQKNREALSRCRNLTVIYLPIDPAAGLQAMVQRSMQLQFTIDDGRIWLSSGERSSEIVPVRWQA